MKNKYIKVSHISEVKFREIMKLFSEGLSATQITNLTKLNRDTINNYWILFKKRSVNICVETSPLFEEIEVDESYFGATRVRGKRGRGARGKTIVFGLLKREGKVYTEIVPNVTKATLQGIIRGKVGLDSIIHSDGWRGYHGLVDVGYDKHLRVHHRVNKFVQANSHINRIESF